MANGKEEWIFNYRLWKIENEKERKSDNRWINSIGI